MLRGLRENGPVVLVPLAWTFAVGALGYAAGVFLPSEPLVIGALALGGAGQTEGIVAAVVGY